MQVINAARCHIKRYGAYRCIRYLTLLIVMVVVATAFTAATPRVLVLTETAGWDHGTRAAAYATITALGEQGGFLVDTSSVTDGRFTDAALAGYASVCFVNTTGNVFTDAEAAAFERYMQSGGGYVGVHASTDAEYGRPWYAEMTGANFNGHPFNVATAKVAVPDKSHPSTRFITADTVTLTDEWYFWADNPDFRNNPLVDPANGSGITVLMNLVESSISGSTLSGFHPICWYKGYGAGRVWYCGLGHAPQTFGDALFKQALLGGIYYAAGMTAVAAKSGGRGREAHVNGLTPNKYRVALYDIRGRTIRTEAVAKSGSGSVERLRVGAGSYLRIVSYGTHQRPEAVIVGR